MTVKKTNNSVRNHATPILLSLFSAGLAGCSSVGTSTTDSATDSATDSTTDSTTSGVASKGLLNHAEVFIDVDGDGVWTSGVDSDKVRTEADGSFSIETNLTGDIVVQTDETTIDGSSGAVLAGVKMSAMAGSSVVTVATTLTNALVNSSGDTLSQADAEAQVKAILGLDASTDVSSYNAYAAENAGTAESIAFEKTAQQVMTIINTLAEAEATSSIGSDVSKSVALDKAVAAFVDVIEAKVAAAGSGTATAIDFKDADIITKVIDAAAVNDTSSIFATGAFIGDPLDTIKTAIQTVNKAIDAVTSLDASSKQIFSVAQSSLIDMTQAVASTNNATKASILSTTDISTLVVVKGATAGLTAEDAASVTDAGSLVLTGTALVADPNTADDVTYTFETTVVSIGSDSASGNPLGTLTITAEGVWTYTLNNNHAEIQALGASDSLVEVFQIKTLASDAAINNPDGSTKFISVRVLGSNDAPTLSTAIVAQTIAEDSVFSLTIPSSNFADVDTGDTSTLTATLEGGAALPSWLTFVADTGVLSGTPTNHEVGSINITVTSTDASKASVADTFSLTVTNTNDAPTVTHVQSDQTATQDSAFTYTVPTNTFADVDTGDTSTLTATLESGADLPSWLTFIPETGVLSGTPTNDEVGSIKITVTSTDTSTAYVSDTFSLTVANVNDAPIVVNIQPDQTATQDSAFAYTVPTNTFADVDTGDTSTLTATLESGADLPSWLTFIPDTGVLSGAPTNDEVGSINITVTSTDASTVSVSDTFSLTVANINDAPRVANALVDQSLISGREGTYSIATDSFYDIDAGETATLTYTATPIPTWGSFDEDTLTFTATPPDIDSVVSVVVTVTATDTTGATVSSTFIVTVMANQAPVVATLGDQTATEDTEVNFTLADSNFTDGNGDAMVVSVSGNPDWLKFDANTKTFSGTPTINNEAGTSTIIVTATDASNTTGTATFDLVTTAANDAPVFTSAPSVNVTENSFTAATVAVSDEESDTMTYSLSGTDASSFSIDSSTGKLSFVGTPRTDMVMLLDSSGNSGALLADNYTSTTTDSVTQVTMDLYVLPKAGDAESLAGFQFNQISSDSAADMSIVNDSTIGGAFTNNGAKSIWYDTSASNSLGAVKIGTITIANYDATETYSIETIKMLGGDDGTTTSPKLVTNDLIISSVTDLPVANSTYSVDVTATDSNDSTSSATQTLAITVDATATNPNSSTSTATWTGTAGTDTYTIDSLTASSADGGNGDNDVVKISIENHTRWDTTGGTSDLVATLVDMEIIDIGNVISSNDSSPVVIGDFSTNMIINSTSAASMVAGADSQVSIMGTTNDIVTLSGTTWAKSSSSSSSLSSGDYSSQVLDAWSDGSSTTLHIDQEINIVTPDIV